MDRLPDIPLLTADQEHQLAVTIEAGVLAAAVRDGRLPAPRCRPTAAELGELAAAGRRAELAFLESNLRLVKMVSLRAALRSGMPEEDLFQDGYLGMAEALWRFDHRRRVRFATYALPWIRARVAESVRRRHLIRTPTSRTGERPRMEPFDEGEHIVPDLGHGDPGSVAGATSTPAPTELPWHQLARDLAPRDWQVLQWRFGIDGDRCSHDEVARRLGSSRATSRRIERRALAGLRQSLARYGVEYAPGT